MENQPTFSKADLYKALTPEALPKDSTDLGDGRRQSMWQGYMEKNIPSGSLVKEEYNKQGKYENLFKAKKPKPKKRVKSVGAVDASLSALRNGQKTSKSKSKIAAPASGARFETFVPLKNMWMGYIDKVVQIKSLSASNYQSACAKLMKADLHGCPVVVQRSRCPSYIGVAGIVMQETRNVFVLITPSHQTKRVPKKHSIFSVVLGDFLFSIHGNHFLVKPGDRAGKKFKTKASVDL